MRGKATAKAVCGLAILAATGGLGACNSMGPTATGSVPGARAFLAVSDEERDCLGRAMYFEAKRSDEDALLAVGTVVMNRTEAGSFPHGICEVVGQRGQFASGVLTKAMERKDLQKIADVADAVLAGERHEKVGKAMYFHTAGRRFSYPNMHYVAVIGGNAFYEKRRPEGIRQTASIPAVPVAALPAGALAFASVPGRFTQ